MIGNLGVVSLVPNEAFQNLALTWMGLFDKPIPC
jgi:hypothetical protein